MVAAELDTRTVPELFQSLGLPPAAYDEFEEMMNPGPAIQNSDAPAFVKAMFQSFYEATWFRVNGSTTLTQSRRGSRPGDTFADLTFGFALNRILRPVFTAIETDYPEVTVELLSETSPYVHESKSERMGLLAPIWADDVAISFSAATAESLVTMAGRIAGLVFDRLAVAGLMPNLSKGKSEIILDCRGSGSTVQRKAIAHKDYAIPTTSSYVEGPLRVVGTYKHLGSWLEVKCGMRKELRTKFAAAHNIMTQYRSQIFCNRAMTVERKRQFFESLVLSTIVFNCAIWQPPTKRQMQQLDAGFARLFKRLAVMHYGKKAIEWPLDRIIHDFQLLPACETLRVARLRYLCHLIQHGEDHTWSLINTEHSWWTLVEDDLAWMQMYCPEFELPDFRSEWSDFCECLQTAGKRWKAAIRKAIARSKAFALRRFEWHGWHSVIYQDILQAGLITGQEEVSTAEDHYCLACRRTFSGAAACAVHAFEKHDRATPARDFVTGTTCEACLKVFSRHTGLLNHVNRGHDCLAFYTARGAFVTRQPGVNSAAENASCPELPDPCMQAEGPRIPEGPIAVIVTQIQQWQDELLEKWQTAFSSYRGTDALVERLRQATLSTCLYHKEILALFAEWSQRCMTEEEDATLHDLMVFRVFTSSASSEWFLTGLKSCTRKEDTAMVFFQRQSDQLDEIRYDVPARMAYRPKVMAHLFSGTRRPFDIQHVMEEHAWMALSIDIIFDREWGDLNNPTTFHFFTEALRIGILRAWVAGPPCETWSRARENHVQGGPRPVRRRGFPYGLHNLTYKEHRQVTVGSMLLGISFRLMLLSLLFGATGVLEHPADGDTHQNSPSIWRLEITRYLCRFCNCQKVTIMQGHYGGKACKPTSLLIANGATDNDALLHSLRTTALPKYAAIGRHEDGSWRTSELKQYPADFCKAICRVILEGQKGHGDAPCQEIPKEFLQAVSELTRSFDETASMGPDFHG